MGIYLFCFEDERNQWANWQTRFFTPLVQEVLGRIGQREVRLLLADHVQPADYWGYHFVTEKAQPVRYPLSLQVNGQEFVFRAEDGKWDPTTNQEFRLVPWPKGGPQGAVGPHMIVADVVGRNGQRTEWENIQEMARAAAYPWDMVWSASGVQVPPDIYGLGLPKFWSAGHAPGAWKPLVTFAAQRLAARLTAQADREFYYTEYPPALTTDMYDAITTPRWNRPNEWDLAKDWPAVAEAAKKKAAKKKVTEGGKLFVLEDFKVPTQDTEAVGAYLRFLNGEIFAIPGTGLVQDGGNLNEDALWLLMVRFCQALAEGRFAEFRSYYIALRTLVKKLTYELTNEWLQPIAKLRPETRPVHTKLNPARLAQLHDPVLHKTLAEIYDDWEVTRGTAPAIPSLPSPTALRRGAPRGRGRS
jgi:hypothetical protein